MCLLIIPTLVGEADTVCDFVDKLGGLGGVN